MIPESVRLDISPFTGSIRQVASVGGGCIAHASRVEAERGTFFLKYASGEAGETFEAEADGLRALAAASEGTEVRVPTVITARASDDTPGLLLLEWIPPGSPDARYWERFGTGLAALHAAPAPRSSPRGQYGFDADNFIGRLPQHNDWRSDWTTFFRELRLTPQLERARRSGHWRSEWNAQGDRLLAKLGDWLPASPHPAVLHGDLWSGNALADAEGRSWVVDPAAYVGHREADLAMTELFGGFDPRFHAAYRSAAPLDPGYEERRELYNLYHLLNHLNHFGASYASGVARVLRRFGT